MKPIRLSIAVAVLACAVSAPAQNLPVATASIPESQPGKAMSTKEKIQQLKPATNLVEMMQLLKTIHEQVLLIDPYFM